MACTDPRWSASRLVSNSVVVRPNTAFIGVRISWLIMARNADLAAFAVSAAWVSRSSFFHQQAITNTAISTTIVLTNDIAPRSWARARQLLNTLSSVWVTSTRTG